jgi:hypothetical protein
MMKISFAASKTYPGILTILQVIVNFLGETLRQLQQVKSNVGQLANFLRTVLTSRGQQVKISQQCQFQKARLSYSIFKTYF